MPTDYGVYVLGLVLFLAILIVNCYKGVNHDWSTMTRTTPVRCLGCGALFRTYRTGLTFAGVRSMLWSDVPPYRSKSRRAVLGLWHELKVEQFLSDHAACVAVERLAA